MHSMFPTKSALAAALAAAIFILPSAPAQAAFDVCFDNANRGATISFYLYPANNTGRISRKALWQYEHQVHASPSRCVITNKLPGVKPGDRVAAFFTIEGKWPGPAHMQCPGHTVTVEKYGLYRMLYTVGGSTIYDANCKFEVVVPEFQKGE